MTLKKIKKDHWYETTHGIGQAEQVGGTFPPSVMVRIVAPFPVGLRNLTPREVLREVDPPEVEKK